MPNSIKTKQTNLATQVLAGFEKHLASATSITLKSVVYTPAQITTALQALVALRAAVQAAQVAAKAKLTAETAQAPALVDLLVALVAYVKLSFSESPDVLADFGLVPRKVATPQTAAQKAAASVKRKATREARGITTKKAKKALTGNVVDVTMTPVLAGPPVVSTPAAPNTAPALATGTANGTAAPQKS